MVWQTDRSRILDFQACPRKRWLGFHVGGKGIQRKGKSLPLLVGAAVHEGLERLLRYGQADHTEGLAMEGVNHAVLHATLWLSNEFESKGFDLTNENPNDAATVYAAKEQAALVEALLRAWWSWEGQTFHERFEVLEVEQEGRALLAPDVELLFRPDALIRERETGDLWLVSWKTTGRFSQRNIQQAQYDTQSMSEVFGVENAEHNV